MARSLALSNQDTSSGIIQPPPCLLHGIDSLYVSYFFDMRTGRLDWDALWLAQFEAKEARRNRFKEITVGNQTFLLMPYGRKPYSFVLTNENFTFHLAENNMPSCYVQFSSYGLWKNGIVAQLAALDEWAAFFGLASFRAPVVSRADWAFDFHFPAPDFELDHFLSKARKDNQYRGNRKYQTYTFGKGDLVTRFYDKSTEVEEESDKVWFHELWGRKDGMWRAEFQVSCPYFPVHGIRTTDDLMDFQYDLLREVAAHTSLRRPNGDPNRSRWPRHPLWNSLLAVIARGHQHGLVRSFDPAKPQAWLLYQQLKSLTGYLKGAAAREALVQGRAEPLSLDDLLAKLPLLIAEHHDPDAWATDVRAKLTRLRQGQS